MLVQSIPHRTEQRTFSFVTMEQTHTFIIVFNYKIYSLPPVYYLLNDGKKYRIITNFGLILYTLKLNFGSRTLFFNFLLLNKYLAILAMHFLFIKKVKHFKLTSLQNVTRVRFQIHWKCSFIPSLKKNNNNFVI